MTKKSIDSGESLYQGVCDLLLGNDPEFLRKTSDTKQTDKRNLIVAVVHGIDPLDLGQHVLHLPFLSTCSSIPVRHKFSNKATDSVNASTSTTSASLQADYLAIQPSDIESVNSLLLWPPKPAVSLHLLTGLAIRDLFQNYSLVFKVIVVSVRMAYFMNDLD
jgi:hypothetical protein